MTIVRRIARPLLAAQFINGGLGQLRNPQVDAARGGPVFPALAGRSIGPLTLPTDRQQLVKLNGAVMTGAGSLLALNKLPRLSSLLLAGLTVPTTLTGHRFWEQKDPVQRGDDIAEVLKNAGLVGGLLIAAVDTEGKPGLSWRAKRAARNARLATKAVTHTAGKSTRAASKVASRKAKSALR
ncbi:DoxX family protein [Quadrisphaera sp. DSM 44207]|uniref:DoxX family protein n=1 Tax=Quadrisphaera sp. DSM 44207 TaxID=1881057 RepID=UPI0008884017|nr:DoxX family protein [Quadrisphaera sp. DSM 44207]SDQ07879.1 Uncharacterized membrane protein YphA, DoxX/SURF4 family [Quadrisphaera sp. DSM 44207]